jgi:hypothetical protein
MARFRFRLCLSRPITAQGRYGPMKAVSTLHGSGRLCRSAWACCRTMRADDACCRHRPAAGPRHPFQRDRYAGEIMSIPGCQGESAGPATIVAQCVDFRRSAAAGRWAAGQSFPHPPENLRAAGNQTLAAHASLIEFRPQRSNISRYGLRS